MSSMIEVFRRNYTKVLLFIVFTFLSLASPVAAQQNVLEDACLEAPNSTVCLENTKRSIDPVSNETGILKKVINILSVVVGVVAVIMIIIAGFTMVLSGGDPAKVKSSRDTIIYAAVGLVVVALAQTIVIFVVNRV